jgi:methylenetetrahydrofolate--tRNA-(uracil-5-)-methyltransferase
MEKKIIIIGGGLAGCEAAWQVAEQGISVELYEMKPFRFSPAHKSESLAELVCSNSLRSNAVSSAVGLLKEEMRRLGSLVIAAADETSVPAGSALAVDRQQFSAFISDKIMSHPAIKVIREEVLEIPVSSEFPVILATGPLTSESLTADLVKLTGTRHLAFYDAIAPVIAVDSIDMDIVYRKSRWDDDSPGDYLNCPMSNEEYDNFIDELGRAETVPLKEFEKEKYFEGCLPIEVACGRGRDTLRFGPMKPVGLAHPVSGERAHAVVQLRVENMAGSSWNMVGFQTKLTYPEQKRIFRMIPGLEKAEFIRLGSIHRNTFICAPKLLKINLEMKKQPGLFLAGQLSGVEGYVESAAMGLLAGLFAGCKSLNKELPPPPQNTAFAALLGHLTSADPVRFQPSNVNFGLFPPLEKKIRKRERGEYRAKLGLEYIEEWKRQKN